MIQRLAYLLPMVSLGCASVEMTPERAAQLCRKDAGLSDGFGGNIGVGIGSDGARAGGSITITDRILTPQSQAEFMTECIDDRMNSRARPATFGITIGAGT